MKIITADHVLPISSEPMVKGAVAFQGGTIAGVGGAESILKLYPSADVEHYGQAVVLPGFVNCHSHLELTSMRGALDEVEHDFRSWLLRINDLRSAMTEAEIEASALAGAREGAAAGVTCFADIGRYGRAGVLALKGTGLRGIVYQETEFSPDNRTADEDFARLGAKYEELQREETELVSVGLSPHSPYTVGSRLFELIAQYAILNCVPLAIHAAESADELELMMKGEGFFADLYEKYSFEWYSPHCSPIEYLERLGVLSTKPLLAHCVRAGDGDIAKIASYGATIAHCPKSNAKFGHGYAPLEKFIDAGIAVGLGSDSVASNNVCDLLEESRFAALASRNRAGRTRFASAREMIEAATLGGARALALSDHIGSLEVGKQADLAVVSMDHPAQTPINDIYAGLVFSSNARDVVLTIVAGNEVHRKISTV